MNCEGQRKTKLELRRRFIIGLYQYEQHTSLTCNQKLPGG